MSSGRESSPFNFDLNRFMTPKMLIIVLAAALLIWAGATCFYTVDGQENAVILRLGRYLDTTGPGLHLKLPFGVDQNYNVPITATQTMYFGSRPGEPGGDFSIESIMLTGDLNIIDAQWNIQFKYQRPRDWLFKVQDREKTIRDVCQSVINQLVGDRSLQSLISGPERSNVSLLAKDELNRIYTEYELGIEVTVVNLSNILPPQGEVRDAFEDVNKAKQDMERLINEGKQAYNREIPKARGEAERIKQEAEGYAVNRINTARGDTARFDAVLIEYRSNPQATRRRLYIEMVEDVFEKNQSTDLIDRTFQNFLPLKNLNNSSGQ